MYGKTSMNLVRGIQVIEISVLRVFADEKGEHGNKVGVALDTGITSGPERQDIARRLGFSETVFVDDPEKREVSIYNPTREIPFSGHAVVGVAWLLSKRAGSPVASIQCAEGSVLDG